MNPTEQVIKALKCAIALRNTFGGPVGGGKDIYNEALAAMRGMVLIDETEYLQLKNLQLKTEKNIRHMRTAMIAPYVKEG